MSTCETTSSFGCLCDTLLSLRREGNVLIHLPIICASYLPYELLWPHGVIFVIFWRISTNFEIRNNDDDNNFDNNDNNNKYLYRVYTMVLCALQYIY